MATVQIDTEFGFDQRDLDFSTLFNASQAYRSSKIFDAFYTNGSVDEFRGSGFTYDDEGIPDGGTVKSYAGFQGQNRLFIVDGVKIKATAIVDAALTFSTKDDVALVRKALSSDDKFKGADGSDVFMSYDGNDTLNGRRGNDVLTGGEGKDAFVFDTPLGYGNVDRITDFSHKDDTFKLDQDAFKGLGKGHLSSSRFVEVADPFTSKNIDSKDRILYDRKDGDLYFDRDGSGSTYDPVKFAEVKDRLTLDHSDFLIV